MASLNSVISKIIECRLIGLNIDIEDAIELSKEFSCRVIVQEVAFSRDDGFPRSRFFLLRIEGDFDVRTIHSIYETVFDMDGEFVPAVGDEVRAFDIINSTEFDKGVRVA